MKRVLLGLFWFICNVLAESGRYQILSPGLFYLDRPEAVWVSLTGISSTVQLKIHLRLQDKPETVFSYREVTFFPFNVRKQMQVTVSTEDAERENLRGRNVDMELVVTCSSPELTFTHARRITLQLDGALVLIQTDKPVYTPRQKVFARVFTLTRSLRPLPMDIRVDVINPQGVIVQRDDYPADGHLDSGSAPGLVSDLDFPLPTIPIEGDWQIVVRYGRKYALSRQTTFKVKKYVTPTFQVTLTLSPTVTVNTEKIHAVLKAEYFHGGPVLFHAGCDLGVLTGKKVVVFKHLRVPHQHEGDGYLYESKVNGSIEMDFKTQWVRDLGQYQFWFPNIEGSHLSLTCNVTDHVTGETEQVVNQETRFESYAYRVSYEHTQQAFKPGLPYLLQVSLEHGNGEEADNIPVYISLETFGPTGHYERLIQATTDSHGRLWSTIDTDQLTDRIHIEVRASGSTFDPQLSLLPAGTSNSKYISIQPRSTHQYTLQGGQGVFNTLVYLSHPELPTSFLVQARGTIFQLGEINSPRSPAQLLVHISKELSPRMQLLVWQVDGAGELVWDSLEVWVEWECTEDSVVIEERVYEPKQQLDIYMAGPPDTFFALLAVDKAVLSVHDEGRLTKHSMLELLDSIYEDCTDGKKDIFQQSGLHMVSSEFVSYNNVRENKKCVRNKRRRMPRDVDHVTEETEILSNLTKCCQLGEEPNPKIRDNCKQKALRYFLSATNECVEKVFECCQRTEPAPQIDVASTEALSAATYSFRHDKADRQHALETNELPYSDDDVLFLFDTNSEKVRSYFPESWLFQIRRIGHAGHNQLSLAIPDSMTTWDIQAITMHSISGICILEPRFITVNKDLFVRLHLPYEAARGEDVEILASVFNQKPYDVTIELVLLPSEGLCSSGGRRLSLSIGSGSAHSSSWMVHTLRSGEVKVRVELYARPAHDLGAHMLIEDVVQHVLYVENGGIEREMPLGSVVLDPGTFGSERERISLVLHERALPGSEKAVIKIMGDVMGASTSAVLSEDNTIMSRRRRDITKGRSVRLASVLYAAKYLDATKQLPKDLRRQAKKRIKRGVQELMSMRTEDGAYTPWRKEEPSTWLTLWLIQLYKDSQVFGLFTEDPSDVVCSAALWLARQQHHNGSFALGDALSDWLVFSYRTMDGEATLAALHMVSLHQHGCSHEDINQSILRSAAFVRSRLRYVRQSTNYALAVATYALALSGDPGSEFANNLLIKRAEMNIAKQECFWKDDSSLHVTKPFWFRQARVSEVETAAYALLTQLTLNNEQVAHMIARWLFKQRDADGAFVAEQDSVVALKALSQYAQVFSKRSAFDLLCQVTGNNSLLDSEVWINQQNALVQHQFDISRDIGGSVDIEASGTGTGQANVLVTYNVDNVEDTCAYELSVEAKQEPVEWDWGTHPAVNQIGRQRRSLNSFYTLNLHVCVGRSVNGTSGAVRLRVGLFTGFEPVSEDLKALHTSPDSGVAWVEVHGRGVEFDLPRLPRSRHLCVDFRARQTVRVGNVQPVAVTVHSLQEPALSCSTTYHPYVPHLTHRACVHSQCACL